jgi:hypothetical protein
MIERIVFMLALLGMSVAAVSAQSTLPGKVVIARASEDAIALYDASPEVAAIVRDKIDTATARARLERDALAVLAKILPDLPLAKTVTVRVTYVKSADVNPAYGSATFAGIERYANLKVDASDAKRDRSKWAALSENAAPPAWAAFTVVGELPPT